MFVNLINMCLGVFRLGFILFGTLWVSLSHSIVFQGSCSTMPSPPRLYLSATFVTFDQAAWNFPALWLVYMGTEYSMVIIT